MGKNINEFDLPNITDDVNLHDAGYRELQEEYGIVLEPEHSSAKDSLNPNQKNVFDEIMMHVDNDLPRVFFIDGPGGTGKTFLYNALLAEIRSRHVVLLFSQQLKQVLQLIICQEDEASMAKRQAIEAVGCTLQDIIGVSLPFGGKIMVMGSDFRQVLSVITRGTRAQIVDSGLGMSPLWSLTKKMWLTINMIWFSEFLLRVGNGTEEPIEGNYIRIPNDMTIQCNNIKISIK
ncbi:uncharacterized protein LOC110914074 [Helianthus annuus]|uniref:uncharacterized protein LOC110914074 n=1 Tax=Helianthus annuus TaxID=4232 RepID=UPI000B8F3A9F|nr:uncharacterized protein LOC110914074 [Helianthus annuus]